MKLYNDQLNLEFLRTQLNAKKVSVANCGICESSEVNPLQSNEVTDQVISDECDKIEICASNGTDYFLNSEWKPEHIEQVKEYAIASGLDNKKIIMAKYKPKQVKLASVSKEISEEEPTAPKATWDALNVNKKIAHYENVIKKSNWEVNKKASVLKEEPNICGGIKSIRGGESTLINSNPKLANNQNSINNPNAISQLLAEKDQDTGILLAKLNKDKQDSIIQSKANWEQEKIDAMKFANILPKGRVFATQTYNANTGISNSPQCTAYSDKDFKDLPELTEGEKIKSSNSDNLAKMQRTKVEDKEWNTAKASSRYNINDDFTNSLYKKLRK